MANELQGKRIAILAADGVEEVELTKPREAAQQAGAKTEIVSNTSGTIQAVNGMNKAGQLLVDRTVDQVQASDYDALILPGGVANPDRMRQDDRAAQFVRAFFEQRKPVAAICHGPWMLVEADVVRGRTLTSWPSLQTDIRNAGGNWEDVEVDTDHGLITSRKPADLPAFCRKMVEEFAEGQEQLQRTSAA